MSRTAGSLSLGPRPRWDPLPLSVHCSSVDFRQRFSKFHDFKSNHRKKYERTCRDWAKGECKNEACPYWHYRVAGKDRVKKNQICMDYLAGTCKFGDECIYAHTNIIPADDNDATYLKVRPAVWLFCCVAFLLVVLHGVLLCAGLLFLGLHMVCLNLCVCEKQRGVALGMLCIDRTDNPLHPGIGIRGLTFLCTCDLSP